MHSSSGPAPFGILSTAHGTIIVSHNDYSVNHLGQRYGVGHQLFSNGCYEPEELGLITTVLNAVKQASSHPVVFLDCGANIGIHTVELARFMHGWGRIIAFEAQEFIYYALCGNIALNNCFNARAVHAALGKECGTLSIPKIDYLIPASIGSLELKHSSKTEFIGQTIDYAESAGVQTPMITLDSLNLEKVDFIKMDIEGMEMEVLHGALSTLKTFRPTMLVEALKINIGEFNALMAELGYKCYGFGINALAVHPENPVASLLKFS